MAACTRWEGTPLLHVAGEAAAARHAPAYAATAASRLPGLLQLHISQTQMPHAPHVPCVQVIDRVPDIDPDAAGEEPEGVEGNIELRNVKFAYPARSDVMVFNGFDLTVPAGKTVALVGSSGSGKSTVGGHVLWAKGVGSSALPHSAGAGAVRSAVFILGSAHCGHWQVMLHGPHDAEHAAAPGLQIVGLIERFYDPLEGQVLLDGRDLKSLKLTWLRDQVSAGCPGRLGSLQLVPGPPVLPFGISVAVWC